jgi:RNA polymerase sigma-70 factor (ECF subfamily)
MNSTMPGKRAPAGRVTIFFLVTRAPGARSPDVGDEADLVARLRRGDVAAFDEAFALHRPRVYSFLVRLSRRRDLAEDLLQETFVRLARHAVRLAPDTRLASWLFRVARNLWVSHCRSAAVSGALEDALAQGEAPAGPTPFEELAATELQRRLERAIASLAPTYREVILLVAVSGLAPAEAATVLDITPEALRQRLARARGLLDDALAEPAPIRRSAT